MKQRICAAAAILGAASIGAAQSVNIDFNTAAGQPDAAYPAVGAAGVWNAIDVRPSVPVPLVRIDGEPTDATVTVSAPATPLAFDDPGTTGNDQALLDDGIAGPGDIAAKVTLAGLTNGMYEVAVYAWMPTNPANMTLVAFNEIWAGADIVGGAWPGDFEEGVTHVTNTLTVDDGTLTISVVGAQWGQDGFLNGMQLRRLITGDMDDNGTVDGADLAILLGAWGPCADCDNCDADLDDTCKVDGADLAILLGNWS